MTPEQTNAAIESVRRTYQNYVIGRVKPPTAAKMARELLKLGDKFLLDNVVIAGREKEIERFTKQILAHGERDSTALLCNLASRIVSESCCLTPTLAGYVQKILDKEAERLSRRKQGRPKERSSDPRVDYCIVQSVEILLDVFPRLKATRQRESKVRPGTKRVESACSLVKKGLEKAGHRMTERAIEGVWNRYLSLKKPST